jgi:tetratricopeptide (TPR) repeat protein
MAIKPSVHLGEQAASVLSSMQGGALEAAQCRELSTLYWNLLSQGITDCVHSKADLGAFFSAQYDFVNFGLVADALENASQTRKKILETPAREPYLPILVFSDWLAQVCKKIVDGDKRELLEKEIRLSTLQVERCEKEINDIQNQRSESVRSELSRAGASARDADIAAHLDMMGQLDVILRLNLRFKKAVSKGAFFSVAEKRNYCERENTITDLRSTIDRFLEAIPPKERAAIKGYSSQIVDDLGRIIDYEDSIDKMLKESDKLEKRKESISPLEIEARIVREIDYMRDLVKLSAKRLHLESRPFIRQDDACFTRVELSSCLDRILEFDPGIFHNDRVPLFGKPSLLLIPGIGNSMYDWKNNVIIVPTLPPSGNFMASVACGMIEYRLDTDEDKRLLTSYSELPQYAGARSMFHLKAELTKDYIAWMTSEFKGYKILAREVRKWFEHEIAPNKTEIYTPPQFAQFELSTTEFNKRFDAVEDRLSKNIQQAPPEDLWAGSILNYQRGNFQRTLDLLTALIAKNPAHEKALYNLGVASMKLMHKQDAIRFFSDYAKVNPQSWWTGVAMDHVRRLRLG